MTQLVSGRAELKFRSPETLPIRGQDTDYLSQSSSSLSSKNGNNLERERGRRAFQAKQGRNRHGKVVRKLTSPPDHNIGYV